MDKDRLLGSYISKLLEKGDLTREESFESFSMILNNEVTDMQQGGFLAALTGKGPTASEIAGGCKAVYELDTNKVDLSHLTLVDNCGTGMDSFKTFNISTAASLVAASGGITVARHGARAISSNCGTVDMAEMLGVDVECSVDVVARSIGKVGIGLFNGMSEQVHPMALGRILSQTFFGSPLNIVASLAHPAIPRVAVRGVYSAELVEPVAEVMKEIGYSDALVVHGTIDGSDKGMDEGSVCGKTHFAHLTDGAISLGTFSPEDVGLVTHPPAPLCADEDRGAAAENMYRLLSGQGERARLDAVILNGALIFFVAKQAISISDGVKKSREILHSGMCLDKLKSWVSQQSRNPEKSLYILETLQKRVEAR